MKRIEKQRLIRVVQHAVDRIQSRNPKIASRVKKAAATFSPTNASKYRQLSEMVWWLIATNAYSDALSLLDALCELDDEYFWMPHALASAFATRAWLNSKQKNNSAARLDAKSALEWVHHGDPYPTALTKAEITKNLKRFDDWLERADNETSPATAIQVLSHALRVLVMYQQFAKAGDLASKSVPSRDFTMRLNAALKKLRIRLENWDAA